MSKKDDKSLVVGWYVEVPRSLRDAFDKMYPGKRNKKILTITAIQYAMRRRPKSLYNLYREEARRGMESASNAPEGSSAEPSAGESQCEVSGEHSGESATLGNGGRAAETDGDKEQLP